MPSDLPAIARAIEDEAEKVGIPAFVLQNLAPAYVAALFSMTKAARKRALKGL